MGWAKYFEDNMEISQGYLDAMCSRYDETDNKVTCKAPVSIFPSIIIQIKPQPVPSSADRKEQTIVCKDCGKKFSFSVKSQEYFEKRGWTFPKRCKKCRDFRKTKILMCSSY